MSIETVLKEHTRLAAALQLIDGQFASIGDKRLHDRRELLMSHWTATASALRHAYINKLENKDDSSLGESFWEKVRSAVHEYYSLGDVYKLDLNESEHLERMRESVHDAETLLDVSLENESVLLNYFDDCSDIDEIKDAIARAKIAVTTAKSTLVHAYITALEAGVDADDMAPAKLCVHGILDAEGVS